MTSSAKQSITQHNKENYICIYISLPLQMDTVPGIPSANGSDKETCNRSKFEILLLGRFQSDEAQIPLDSVNKVFYNIVIMIMENIV